MSHDVKKTVAEFFGQYPLVRYAKGDLLLRPDETPKTIFFLIEGQIAEYDISSTGNEVVVNVFKPGAFFPMSLAINQNRNEYFFETTTLTTVREAPHSDVITFIKDNPAVAYDLLSRVYHGTDGLIRRMAHLMGGKARSRLIFELLNGAARFGEAQAGNAVYLPMTEKDIAKRSGLSRETVSRTMSSLKDEGLVAIRAGGIYIPDIKLMTDVIGNQL